MKESAIIVDLDGTLCNTDHRQHHMTGAKKNWMGFYDALVDDEPHDWCLALIKAMSESHRIIYVSGRPDTHIVKTMEWLEEFGLLEFYPERSEIHCALLFMRKANDYRKDAIVKEEIYRQSIEPKFEIVFCVDDRKQVVDMWRMIGLTCLQCAHGDF